MSFGPELGGSESSFTINGPFSVKNPIKEEEPGPPFNQSATGSVFGLPSDSTNQSVVHVCGRACECACESACVCVRGIRRIMTRG